MRQEKISWLNKVRPNCYNLDHLFGFWREWDVMLAIRQMKNPDVICLPAIVLFIGDTVMIHMFGERERSDPSQLRTVTYDYRYTVEDDVPMHIQAIEKVGNDNGRSVFRELEKFEWGLLANDIFSMRFADELWYYEHTTWDEVMAMGFPEQPALDYIEYFVNEGHEIPQGPDPAFFADLVRKRMRRRGFTEEDIQTMGDEIDIDGHISDDTCDMITMPDEVRDAIEKLGEVPGLRRKEYVVGTLKNPDEFLNQQKS
jgi:hypothetical protein